MVSFVVLLFVDFILVVVVVVLRLRYPAIQFCKKCMVVLLTIYKDTVFSMGSFSSVTKLEE